MSGRFEVVTLGEALVVMDPCGRGPLERVGTFTKRVGGAEVNVATALARLGHRSAWAGTLGDDSFGREILAFLRGEGVDTSAVRFDPEAPNGLYFKERGALGRLRAYYFRSGSAASRSRFEDLNLERLLSGEVLHLSGITPALSESCHEMTKRLLSVACEQGIIVSFDANVRWRLFDSRHPRKVLCPLLEFVDLLFLSEDEAQLLLGGSDRKTVEHERERLDIHTVVVHGSWGARATTGTGTVERPSFRVEEIDPVGAGDAFVAGYLSARLRGWETEQCLGLANACGAFAVTVPGDAESMPLEEPALALLEDSFSAER
jgi:2-dehydro-3-deoxygluconokinase